MSEELKQAAQQALEALEHAEKDAADFQRLNTDQTGVAIKSLRRALTQRPAAQTEREAFERAALAKWGPLDFERSEAVPEMYYNQRLDDAWIGFGFAVAWQARASLPAPQQATPDLADGPARMHWTNWMPVKDALEYAYQKMGLEMVKTDAGAKYPNLHWNLAGLVREFVVAQQDAMFGKCQACGKSMGLLDQIKCLDCGTRLCEPCAKEHFGGDHGARAAASHSHPAPTTSGWVETSAPPQRLDWSDTQQATPDPVGEPVFLVATGEIYEGEETYQRYEGSPPPLCDFEVLYTRPAPGVPEGFALVPVEPTLEMLKAMESQWLVGSQVDMANREYAAMLAAAQAKGGQA